MNATHRARFANIILEKLEELAPDTLPEKKATWAAFVDAWIFALRRDSDYRKWHPADFNDYLCVNFSGDVFDNAEDDYEGEGYYEIYVFWYPKRICIWHQLHTEVTIFVDGDEQEMYDAGEMSDPVNYVNDETMERIRE